MTSPTFVLDASVALAWLFPDEASAYADAALQAVAGSSALVPAVWVLEVTNAAAVAERRKRIRPLASAHFFELLAELALHQEELPLAASLAQLLPMAREFQISAYDAAYLDLALRHHLPLATLDGGLRAAAGRAGVALFNA